MKNFLEFEKEKKTLEEDMEGLKSPFGSELAKNTCCEARR